MKKELIKALSNWRCYVLLVLGFFAMAGVLGVPDDNSPTWFRDLVFSKAVGCGLCYAVYRLAGYWSKRNLIPGIDKLAKEED